VRLKNLQFWDGVADATQQGDLVIADGVFTDLTSSSSEKDCSGLFAIPGLIDAHIHLCLNPEIKDPFEQDKPGTETLKEEMRERTSAMVRAGITTARDLGGGAHLEFGIRDEIDRGETIGPRLICAGQPITSPGGHCHFWGGEAASTEEAMVVLERQRDRGADLIKIMVTGGNITPGSRPVDSQFSDDTVNEVVRKAEEHGYHVAAHCHGTGGIRQAATAGVRTIEHCSWVGDEGWGRAFDPDVVKLIAEGDTWVSPTINSGWKRFRQEDFVSMVQGNYQLMKAAGIRLIASTDAGIPNVHHHDLPFALPEFARFAGLSPVEALRTATSECALAIGLGGITGRIAEGFSADLVLYEKNPLDDLAALQHPVAVYCRGVEVATGN
jgi:imidazolonepropionase-like amidohydrolase